MAILWGIWILPINSMISHHNDVKCRNWVIKICLDVGNDKYILCNFYGSIMSSLKLWGEPPKPPLPPPLRSQEEKKSPVQNRVNAIQF